MDEMGNTCSRGSAIAKRLAQSKSPMCTLSHMATVFVNGLRDSTGFVFGKGNP